MRRAFVIGGLFFVLTVVGCGGGDELSRIAREKRNEELRLEAEREKELLGRLDEFKSMTAPVKLQRPYLVLEAVILIRMPGKEFEVANKDWTKGGVVKSLVRADCKQGRKLMDLELVGIEAGPLYATVCSVTVIDIDTKTTVASSEVIADKPEIKADKSIDPSSLVDSIDKKSHFVHPYVQIRDHLFDLGRSVPKK